jgi:hypothetical protein
MECEEQEFVMNMTFTVASEAVFFPVLPRPPLHRGFQNGLLLNPGSIALGSFEELLGTALFSRGNLQLTATSSSPSLALPKLSIWHMYIAPSVPGKRWGRFLWRPETQPWFCHHAKTGPKPQFHRATTPSGGENHCSEGKHKGTAFTILQEKAMRRALDAADADWKEASGKRHNSDNGPTHPWLDIE